MGISVQIFVFDFSAHLLALENKYPIFFNKDLLKVFLGGSKSIIGSSKIDGF